MFFSAVEWVQLLMAFLGSAGFAMIFRTPVRCLFPASLGGLVSWAVYLFTLHAGRGYLMACLLSGLTSALWAEVLARIMKKPVTLFLVSAVIPLIPGRDMYRTMSALVLGDLADAGRYGQTMVLSMIFIAAGTSFVAAVFLLFRQGKPQETARGIYGREK